MSERPTYRGLFKVANKLTLGKCECGKDIVVDVELSNEAEEQQEMEMEKEAQVVVAAQESEEEDREPTDEELEAIEHDSEEDSDAHFDFGGDESLDLDHMSGHMVGASVEADSLESFVKKASSIVDHLDTVADRVEKQNPRLAARIDAVSNEIEKRVARILQRRQNAK